MNQLSTYSILTLVVPCLIPPYAFRLTRAFGTRRVGWMLFATFTLLALLQVVRAFWPAGFGLDPTLTLDLVNLLVPILLLIGLVHMETWLKERQRVELEETRLRQSLEMRVEERTAELDKANDELQREITMRKQGEAELKSSKEHYRFLFDENPQPMWIYDRASMKFLAFNAAALRFYGYSGNEFRELLATSLCLPADAEAFEADSNRPISELQPRAIRRHRKKDGSVVEVETTGLDMNYAGASARLILATDVTAQRQLQKQLLQNQKLAVTNQLAGGVADNFTHLIASIQTDAASLVHQCADPSVTQQLRRIAATGSSAAALTRQLLALIRRHPMRAEILDLNQLIEEHQAELTRLLGPKVTLEKGCWPGLPPVAGDPALLAQVLRNLVQNARDAMPNGGTLTLSTTPVTVDEARARSQEDARPGPFVCLTVADTGCGMSPEVQARLFEPFFTTKDASRSIGLGLASVHGLVKQHSGWIEVSSTPDAGSRFNVFLPAAPGRSKTEILALSAIGREPAARQT